MLAPLLLAAGSCGQPSLIDRSEETVDVPCRDYGSAIEATRIARKWMAEHKSRFDEVIDDVAWDNSPWTIGFSLRPSGEKGYANVTLLPGGEIVRCETTEICIVTPPPDKPACPKSQKRIVTEAQAMEIAAKFLEQRGMSVDRDIPPQIHQRPAWSVFVELLPPMPGGHYWLSISADGEVVGLYEGI